MDIPVKEGNSLNMITGSSQSGPCVNATVGEVNVAAELRDLITQSARTHQPADLRLASQSLETLLRFLISSSSSMIVLGSYSGFYSPLHNSSGLTNSSFSGLWLQNLSTYL